MVIKRLKKGLKKLAAGIVALLVLFSSATHAGDKALADSIRDCNNWAIMTGVAGVVGITYGVGCLMASKISEDKEAEVAAAIRGNRALLLGQIPQYKAARRIWLMSLVSSLGLCLTSGSIALKVVQDDDYNNQARFTAGVYGALACLTTGRTVYNIF
jgi:hypothetical protein